MFSQVNNFTNGGTVETASTDSTPMKIALEDLDNIDDVTVTLSHNFTFDASGSTLVLVYEIAFTGDCVRGNIPEGALAAPVCDLGATTTTVQTMACRYAVGATG